MNKAITDGIVFMPPAFEEGLGVWSSGDGTPGSDTYQGASNAALVPSDQDFGSCLELLKTQSTQKLRHMGQTPIAPGCYLRVTARVKVMSGNIPSVRIAAYPARSGGAQVTGVPQVGPTQALGSYNNVVEVSAIIGSGNRGGVDMAWGTDPAYAHVGLDLTGQNGGVVRIDDLIVEDVSSVFVTDLLSQVDVRDYGAAGDGSTDDTAAFEAANAAAGGRDVLVPAGTFFLASDVTFDTNVRFEGTVTMPTEAMLLLRRNYSFAAYVEAFGDEELAFKKAFQALLNNADHDSLDLGGRKVAIYGPIDMQAAVPNKTSYATRRVIRNGQLEASGPDSNWANEIATSVATYSANDSRKLTNVQNVANIKVGSLVTGSGVGREIYVRSKNVGAQEITLNAPLFDAEGTQTFTFTRFQYLLDFSGFTQLSKFSIADVELQLNGMCSGILLADTGLTFHLRDSYVSRPKDRGLTSPGNGCQGMKVDRCNFLSSEDSLEVPDRVSIGMNANQNDVKIRDNRATKFRHFMVIAGSNAMITGNHFFQGDGVQNGIRSAGLVLAEDYVSALVSGNYVDNCFIEWTNERDPTPNFSSGFSFSALSISENIFLSGAVAPWFSYLVVKPHGTGHFINGLSVTGNKFRTINGSIDRVDRVDTSFADLDYSRFNDITFDGNSYHSVDTKTASPLKVKHDQPSNASTWVVETAGQMPFEGQARNIDALVAIDDIRNNAGVRQYEMPFVEARQGANNDAVNIRWSEAMRGEVAITIRVDN